MKFQPGDVIRRDNWCPLRIIGIEMVGSRPHYKTLKACVGQPLKKSPDARVPLYAQSVTHSARFLGKYFENAF